MNTFNAENSAVSKDFEEAERQKKWAAFKGRPKGLASNNG